VNVLEICRDTIDAFERGDVVMMESQCRVVFVFVFVLHSVLVLPTR